MKNKVVYAMKEMNKAKKKNIELAIAAGIMEQPNADNTTI